MKLLKIALLIGASLAGSLAANAQSIVHSPVFFGYYINYVQNPGFENSTTSPWIDQSWMEGDEIQYTDLGSVTTAVHHTGSKSWNMNIGENVDGVFFNSVVTQYFPTPFSSNLTYASVWVNAGQQTLYVEITYSDGTASNDYFNIDYYNSAAGSNGWQLFNFLPSIQPNKMVTSISFSAGSMPYNTIYLDDVQLAYSFSYYWYY